MILCSPRRYFNSAHAGNVSVPADIDQVRADDDSARADNDSGHAHDDSSRVDDDSGRADVVGEVASFVYREEIEAGTGSGSSSNCAKIGNQYVVRARKAIQAYFGPIPPNTPRSAVPARTTARARAAGAMIVDLPKVA